MLFHLKIRSRGMYMQLKWASSLTQNYSHESKLLNPTRISWGGIYLQAKPHGLFHRGLNNPFILLFSTPVTQSPITASCALLPPQCSTPASTPYFWATANKDYCLNLNLQLFHKQMKVTENNTDYFHPKLGQKGDVSFSNSSVSTEEENTG